MPRPACLFTTDAGWEGTAAWDGPGPCSIHDQLPSGLRLKIREKGVLGRDWNKVRYQGPGQVKACQELWMGCAAGCQDGERA